MRRRMWMAAITFSALMCIPSHSAFAEFHTVRDDAAYERAFAHYQAQLEMTEGGAVSLYDRDHHETTRQAQDKAEDWGMEVHRVPGISVPTTTVWTFHTDTDGNIVIPDTMRPPHELVNQPVNYIGNAVIGPQKTVSAHDTAQGLLAAVETLPPGTTIDKRSDGDGAHIEVCLFGHLDRQLNWHEHTFPANSKSHADECKMNRASTVQIRDDMLRVAEENGVSFNHYLVDLACPITGVHPTLKSWGELFLTWVPSANWGELAQVLKTTAEIVIESPQTKEDMVSMVGGMGLDKLFDIAGKFVPGSDFLWKAYRSFTWESAAFVDLREKTAAAAELIGSMESGVVNRIVVDTNGSTLAGLTKDERKNQNRRMTAGGALVAGILGNLAGQRPDLYAARVHGVSETSGCFGVDCFTRFVYGRDANPVTDNYYWEVEDTTEPFLGVPLFEVPEDLPGLERRKKTLNTGSSRTRRAPSSKHGDKQPGQSRLRPTDETVSALKYDSDKDDLSGQRGDVVVEKEAGKPLATERNQEINRILLDLARTAFGPEPQVPGSTYSAPRGATALSDTPSSADVSASVDVEGQDASDIFLENIGTPISGGLSASQGRADLTATLPTAEVERHLDQCREENELSSMDARVSVVGGGGTLSPQALRIIQPLVGSHPQVSGPGETVHGYNEQPITFEFPGTDDDGDGLTFEIDDPLCGCLSGEGATRTFDASAGANPCSDGQTVEIGYSASDGILHSDGGVTVQITRVEPEPPDPGDPEDPNPPDPGDPEDPNPPDPGDPEDPDPPDPGDPEDPDPPDPGDPEDPGGGDTGGGGSDGNQDPGEQEFDY